MRVADVGADLLSGDLALSGRITTASNATFLGTVGDTVVVYKPIAGEKPLWDFPDGDLAHREVAAHLVSEAFGWNIVPRTWLRDGPLGEGMVQLWQELDPEQDAVDLVPSGAMPESGWRHVFDGTDEDDRAVALIHEDTAALRRMAVFDIVVNNADRKGAHILPMADGHRYGVDHGLTLHSEHKLRTVLWGWIGEELSTDEREGVERVREQLDAGLGERLGSMITDYEVEALRQRCERLLTRGAFPPPRGQMPAVPWPLF
ncbi:SCO1664 family protein [Marisediminicola sp. LYQ134]|uniref:SCO1664 family protein n=1 Tax=Marisediminicola sp. LYQ134 TaxID=3391061 RepID=UPI0039837164